MKTEFPPTNEQPYNIDGAFLFDKTIESSEDLNDFILSMDDFRLSEAAMAMVSAMRGKVYHQYQDEVDKSNPDAAKVRALKAELTQIAAERELIYSGDQDAKRLVISKYAPIIKAEYADFLAQEAAQEQPNGR